MEIITTAKGTKKLCYDGFMYTKKKSSKSTIRWECSQRHAKSCKGAITTNLESTVGMSQTPHSHLGDQFSVEATKVRTEILAAADANRGKPSQILADKLIHYPVQVRAAVGQTESLKRAIRRTKRGGAPAEPAAMADIPRPLPEGYTTTTPENEETFLVYDNQSEDSRILIFASQAGLGLLEDADTWFLDGTFSTAPPQFTQLFSLRVPLGDGHVSAMYALLPGKRQQHYEECLTAILDVCLQRDIRPNPVTVLVDYEVAIHNALRSVISPNIDIQGCFYHLTQATWRKLQAEGLSVLYKTDERTKHFCGMLDGLAFLPLEDVEEGMAVIRERADEVLSPVVDYFDSTYVSGTYRSVVTEGRMRFRRTPPRFEPALWNVHTATLRDGDRTNNVCEGWNNGFRHLVGHNNPSLWVLVNCLQKDNASVETDVFRQRTGQPPKKRKRTNRQSHQAKLKKLCEDRQGGTRSVESFLEAIGHCIRLA